MSSYIEMQIIAVEVANSNHGDFIKHVANAWINADPGNKALLEPVWRILINKYGLTEEYVTEIEEHRHEYVKVITP